MKAENLPDEEIRALDRRPAGAGESMVPSSYAEKAMSSLLRLHEDLVEEKERRIDLYRRLMEREQSLAEMRAYVKLLEGELARRGFDPTAYALDPAQAPAVSPEARLAVAQAAGAASARPPPAPAAPAPAAAEPVARSASPAFSAPRAATPAPADGPVLAWTPGAGGGTIR